MPKLPKKGSSKDKKGNSSNHGALVFKSKREPKKVIIGVVLVVYLVAVGAFYGILISYKKSIQSEIQAKEQKIKKLRQEERTPLAKEVLSFKRRADNLDQLLEDHRDWISVFNFLERSTLPQVQYTDFSGDYSQKSLRLKAQTSSYRNLARQIYIFRDNSNVEEVLVSNPRLKEDGVVFEIELKLVSGLWESNN